ncbi:MAG: FliM/FliN family flagellar motor switch protein [Planctomycetes bacterium]|nr:FliM/FliN family flagellar motor switch protein [Planctomycetota bacterium]
MTVPNVDRILNVQVPVIVVLAEKKMEVGDVLNLTPGSVVEFEKPADEYLEVLVNNQRIARGEAVRVGERFGVQIREVGTTIETIRAMGRA